MGQVLRQGLYSSHLTTWRKAAHSGSLKALSKKRGRKPERPLDEKVRKLERRNARSRMSSGRPDHRCREKLRGQASTRQTLEQERPIRAAWHRCKTARSQLKIYPVLPVFGLGMSERVFEPAGIQTRAITTSAWTLQPLRRGLDGGGPGNSALAGRLKSCRHQVHSDQALTGPPDLLKRSGVGSVSFQARDGGHANPRPGTSGTPILAARRCARRPVFINPPIPSLTTQELAPN